MCVASAFSGELDVRARDAGDARGLVDGDRTAERLGDAKVFGRIDTPGTGARTSSSSSHAISSTAGYVFCAMDVVFGADTCAVGWSMRITGLRGSRLCVDLAGSTKDLFVEYTDVLVDWTMLRGAILAGLLAVGGAKWLRNCDPNLDVVDDVWRTLLDE